MAENSKIEWTHHTFNSWIGCTEVSPACDNCYARVLMQDRFKKAEWGKGKERVLASDAMWEKPLTWNRRAEKNGVRERMIWKPKAGQRVVIRYAKKRAQLFPYHNRVGVVVVASSGTCAVNAMVCFDDGSVVVVPRGNLVAVES